jgi:hypothetical protein
VFLATAVLARVLIGGGREQRAATAPPSGEPAAARS